MQIRKIIVKANKNVERYLKQNFNVIYKIWIILRALLEKLVLHQNKGATIYMYYPLLSVGFISIPKNANSTINASLLKKSGISFDERDYATIHKKKKHLSTTKRKLFHLNKKAFTFAFARNPYSRLVSCYKNKIHDEQSEIKNVYFGMFNEKMSFEKFVKQVCKIPDFLSDPHFRSQSTYLFYRKRPMFDYLGHIENFDRDFEYVAKKFELSSITSMNVSRKEDWRTYYNPELAQLVYNRYKKDFKLLGYKKECHNLLEFLSSRP